MHHRTHRAAKGSWGKRIGVALGVLVLFLVVLYFAATSSGFIKAFILPKVGDSLNAKITAENVSLRPFSSIALRKLRVETTTSEPLLTAEDVLVRYSLFDILGGNINLHEVALVTPVINLIAEPDGKSNLDPILEGPERTEPLKLSIRDLSIKNGTVRSLQKTGVGKVDRTELEGLNVTIDQLGNNQSGKVTVEASFVHEQSAETNNVLAGTFSGTYDLRLDEALLPNSAKGTGQLNISRSAGAYSDLKGLGATLAVDVNPQAIQEVALRFSKGDQQLGQLRVAGPLDLEKNEGNVKIELLSLDRNILALVAGGAGYDFQNTTVNSTNEVAISQNGTFFAASGNLAVSQMSLAKDEAKTPEVDLNVGYRLSVNTSEKSALIEQFGISGRSGGDEFLRAALDQQMNLSWGETLKGYKDAALRLVLTNFNLAQWNAILGTNVQAGIAGANINLVSQQDGKVLNMEVRASANKVTAQFGTNTFENASLLFETAGTVEQLKTVNLPRYALSLSQGQSPLLQATGALRYQIENQEATAQLTAEGPLNRLIPLASVPEAMATAGTFKLSADYTDVGGGRKANGVLAVDAFTGRYGDFQFTNYLASVEYNVELKNQDVEIHRAALKIAQGFNSGGTIDVKGRYNLENQSGQLTFKTVDLNQNAFAPVLSPALGENRLVSISMNASGEARLDPQAENTLAADVKIANWVVQDKEGRLPNQPLSMDISLDGGMQKELLEIRKLALQLTPTQRAKNALEMRAKMDFAATNPAPSSITISSESFDITPYYNLFAGPGSSTNTVATDSPPANPVQETPVTEQEPEPMSLPFQQLTANLKLDQFYLRNIAISNWVGNISIRSNVVQVDPFQLQINGGPVNLNGKFDLGRTGYQYALSFKADAVPLGPIATTFDLAASNQLTGTFVADAQLQGAGITGPNLKKNLEGGFQVSLTNINYLPGGPKLRRILVPISLALRVPELTETPINWVAAQTRITNGTVVVENAALESEAFQANITGTITLDNVLTNSPLNLPLDFWLRRSLAEKSKILPSNTPPDAKYARLGNIYTVRGTLGAPDPNANKAVLAGLALQGAAGFGLGDEKTEKALGTLGNILTGQKGASTNAAGTNASPAANIIEGLGGLLRGGTKTEADGAAKQTPQGTNAPAQEERSNPLGDLLRALPGSNPR